MSEIIAFPGPGSKRQKAIIVNRQPKKQTSHPNGLNMRTALFRSREAVVESDDDALVRDVCLDIDKAQEKLMAIQDKCEATQAELVFLTTAATKLSAAIVAALLSTRGKDEAPSP